MTVFRSGKSVRLWLLPFLAMVTPIVARDRAVKDSQTKQSWTMPWVRNSPGNRGVIIFVHGVTGDERGTWTAGRQFWPEMLTTDPAFNGQNIYVYKYPSPRLQRSFSIDEVAENMRLMLTSDGVLKHDELTFVCHSMGGIVTRAFLLKYQKVVPKVRLLYFFATPTTGTPYALLAHLFSNNTQFQQLYPMDADGYLGPLQSTWLAADFKLKSYCAYETQTYLGQIVVARESATNLCNQRLDPIDANHIDIVKPSSTRSTSYLALKAAFVDTEPPSRRYVPPKPRAGHALVTRPNPEPKENNDATTVAIGAGTIIAAHYPTGELFAVNGKTGALRLLSARLGDICGLGVRQNGEIIVLGYDVGSKLSMITGVNRETGYHREVGVYSWPTLAQQGLALDSDDSAIVALDGALIRVDLNTGALRPLASNSLLKGALGVARLPSGEILVTAAPDRILKVSPLDGATVVLAHGGLLRFPRAPTLENFRSVLVGGGAAAGSTAEGVVEVDIEKGTQKLVATGPFETVAGLAMDSDGTVLVTDNGRGAMGDGFIARLDLQTRRVSVLVSAQTSNWKFLNGRSIAIFPALATK